MKNLIFTSLGLIILILSGCDMNHNFMDVDNANAKEDLKTYIGSGNIPNIKINNIVPDSMSGTINEAKGYAQKYYEDKLEEYVNVAKEGVSGAKQTFKGYYNSGVDELNGVISDKVNGVISGELNKLKIK